MAENSPPSSNELIRLLEEEMVDDIVKIDVKSEDEDKIDARRVNEWYIETEKLIRVIGNQFTAPVNPAINQLRYAGHHILKYNLAPNDAAKRQNIIEAFKHCKRAYYDALDFYIYKIGEDYKVLLPFLEGQNASKLERILREHLQEIVACRLEGESRIEYYKGVQSTLIKGLEIIERLNEIQRESGVSLRLYEEKGKLIKENENIKAKNEILNEHLNTLQGHIKVLDSKIEDKSYSRALIASLVIAAAAAAPAFVNMFLTSKHDVTMHEIKILGSGPEPAIGSGSKLGKPESQAPAVP